MTEGKDRVRPPADGARLPLLSPAAARAAAEEVGIDPAYLTQPIWTMLLARPKYARALYGVLTDLLFRTTLPVRLRELLIMRIGWTTAAEFEWAQHWEVATRAGVDPADLLAVRDWQGSDRFAEADRAALAAADEVVERGEVGDRSWRALRQHFSESEQLELIAVLATWHHVSVLVRSLRVPLDDGMTAWPPDGVAPKNTCRDGRK
ncbi:carboxymuconolactone decarboxylase family protein [Streptomyces gilvus]|uniref:carboxymuconolactone decarboxylase family protein n=1 Tax=Streptomyces gilvus TaxID=2920937 RepID=UPI001F0EB30B|nr:carboxymuconolactone decarboxylase family protein [Streptomyces sp. CME 23]MCH5677573.1 carboxymuconolactone decarboxylase family protein [Streptomyces sp. CME 23]